MNNYLINYLYYLFLMSQIENFIQNHYSNLNEDT